MSQLFTPRKTKFRKPHKLNKGYINGIAPVREFTAPQGGNAVICFGSNVRVTSKQLEGLRMLCSKTTKTSKSGSFLIKPFCHQSVSKKPAETRMGGGKGAPDHYISRQKAGMPLLELFDVKPSDVEHIYYQTKSKIKGDLYLVENK